VIFAKIDFINLLPFYIFIKKYIKSSQIKQTISYKKSYPSAINQQFKKRQIDSAFISSIASKYANTIDLGIVAKKDVLSVLCIKGDFQKDYQSDTSNALAKILDIKGQVLIGDKALKYHYEQHNDSVDLAKLWHDKYNLPFVFARLSFNKDEKYLKTLAKHFAQTKVKIPQYILKKYALNSNLSCKQIQYYLTKISYTIGYKEKQSLKLFFKLTKQKRIQ
jgi:chorismate dehydratase